MTKYQISFSGSAGIKVLDFEENFMNDVWALRHVERSLGNYYPTYYTASVWKVDELGYATLIGEYKAEVTVVRTKS